MSHGFVPVGVVIAAVLAAGCVQARKPITLDYAAIEGVPGSPPVDAAAVHVIGRAEDLPDGITVGLGNRLRDQIAIEKDMPTASDPHRVLGAVTASEGNRDGREALIAAARAEAGKRGGNTIYVLDRRHDSVTALVLHVSRAASTRVFPTAAALLSRPPAPADAYEPSGAPIAIDLASEAAVPVAMARGDCLAIHLALEPDARLTPNVRTLSATRRDSTGFESTEFSATPISHSQRDYVFVVGCAFAPGEQQLELGPNHQLGRGAAQLQIRRKRVDEREVARRERERAAGLTKAGQDDAARAQDRCRACSPHLAACPSKDLSRCYNYTQCLARGHTRLEECGSK